MGALVLRLPCLPDEPLEAAARFYSEQVPLVQQLLEQEAAMRGEPVEAFTIVFPTGGITHHAWQIVVVQALARELAPVRVNGVVGGGSDTIDKTTQWLASAPGVTGQILTL